MALATELLGARQAVPISAQLPPQFEALPLVRSRQNHLLVRAYINGRIDLPQAEAIRDLIEATTLYQARVAAQHHRPVQTTDGRRG